MAATVQAAAAGGAAEEPKTVNGDERCGESTEKVMRQQRAQIVKAKTEKSQGW
jgi:hypothetical protein